MIKGLVSAALCASILVFLEMLLWFTAPKIDCDRLNFYFFEGIKAFLIEYLILILLLILINKFISTLNKKEHLISIAIFSGIGVFGFIYLFYSYAQDLQCLN